MKNRDEIKAISLADYRQPSYWARRVHLQLELDPDTTRVTSVVEYEHNPGHPNTLDLCGKDLTLKAVQVDGQSRDLASLSYSAEHLELGDLPARFTLQVETLIHPKHNSALEGLYLSNGAFFTQCEAQGFRRLTYFLDRPDVMASFQTTIIADKRRYPVLLSNGNCVEAKDLGDGRHLVKWHDPFPKPSYLFALVAGDLGHKEDVFTTRSGRKVGLHIYVEPENLHKCDFAFSALKHAMKWDEDVYGLEYDLDTFMIVAVNDFNMGAMENKGLNIFNAKYVLASPDTATDKDFENILGIVGHEYFHNWSGNRVTLRDWFQLSLKEGLTVFRDQQFSADLGSAAVKRIVDIKRLREHQFTEDDSPLAHPVRPESYIEINNFYTSTVYEKGAEIIRMIYTLLGEETYLRAMTEYFRRFDGQAVTIEDMLNVLEEVSGRSLGQFKRWYQRPGTPILLVDRLEGVNEQTLRFRQEFTKALELSHEPMLIPFRVAFLGADKTPLVTVCNGVKAHEHLLEITEIEQSFTFSNVASGAIPSLLRGFSAPVKLKAQASFAERILALGAETDRFNKYEAAQQLAEEMIGKTALPDDYIAAFKSLLADADDDPYFSALAIQPPTPEQLAHKRESVDLEGLYADYLRYSRLVAQSSYPELLSTYHRFANKLPQAMDRMASARRELRNTALFLLSTSATPESLSLVKAHYRSAKTMTDSIAALQILASSEDSEREALLNDFYLRWSKDPLVLDKWFAAQAGSSHPEVLSHVKALLGHKDFDIYNPNRVFSVFRSFAKINPHGFHHLSGEGYELVSDYVLELDRSNPQTAARLVNVLTRFNNLDTQRQTLMKKALRRVSEHGPLSSDVYEIVSKSLH
jgi:aminopeptidase N